MSFLGRLMGTGALAPAEAAAAAERGDLVVVDVREKHEFLAGHYSGARHLPLGRLDEREIQRLAALEQPIAFVCQAGMRSAQATRRARAQGLDAKNIRGGMAAWQRQGLPVVSGRGGRR